MPRFGSDPSHAGMSGYIISLTSRPELNGVRILLEHWVGDRERWRVKRKDTSEMLGVKVANLAPEEVEGRLPMLINMAVACFYAEPDPHGMIFKWLESGGPIDAKAFSISVPADSGHTLLMCACWNGQAELAAELIRRGANVNARCFEGSSAIFSALCHPNLVQMLLDAGAQTHLRFIGGQRPATLDAGSVTKVGTALKNAEAQANDATSSEEVRRACAASAELIREHERKAASSGANGSCPLRDVFELEVSNLMRCLAATLLAEQSGMGEHKADARRAWLRRHIADAFADPRDAAALSDRFSHYAEARRLDVDTWIAVARSEADCLGRRPGFKEMGKEVADELPGFADGLELMSPLRAMGGTG